MGRYNIYVSQWFVYRYNSSLYSSLIIHYCTHYIQLDFSLVYDLFYIDYTLTIIFHLRIMRERIATTLNMAMERANERV